MKRKLPALIFAALACVCATKNAALAWLSAAVCAVLAAVVWKGKKEAPKKTAARSPDLVKVFVAKNGQVYHCNSICQHVFGHEYTDMTRAQAKKKGFKPCKSCYPYGD